MGNCCDWNHPKILSSCSGRCVFCIRNWQEMSFLLLNNVEQMNRLLKCWKGEDLFGLYMNFEHFWILHGWHLPETATEATETEPTGKIPYKSYVDPKQKNPPTLLYHLTFLIAYDTHNIMVLIGTVPIGLVYCDANEPTWDLSYCTSLPTCQN